FALVQKPVEAQGVRNPVVAEVEVGDRYHQGADAGSRLAGDAVGADLALLPVAERELHLAGARFSIARVENTAEAGAIVGEREELSLARIDPLVDFERPTGPRLAPRERAAD